MRFCVSVVILSVFFGFASVHAASDQNLQSGPVQFEKDRSNIIEVVKTYLQPRAVDGRGKIWVYFTDKNVFTDNDFVRAASSLTLSEEAQKRRAKMGLDKITFLDLPVYQAYIDEIINRGGKLRRVSRWLNAASFELPLEKIDGVNNLPFVARVRPVAVYYSEEVDLTSPETTGLKSGHPEYALNYGESFGQLEMLNVPALHDKGYNGNGIILAMFDTGYRKDHQAFAQAYIDGRVMAEYDFVFNDGNVQNEPEDNTSQHNHGTYIWSTSGGLVPGVLYGPAYGASFILCKTEDIRSETPVEEDNWAAAVEWVDSIGADVITSSLSYSDWYTYSDYDGQTAVITIAANLATSLGIVVCNSMGNSGPAAGTLGAPADAFEILSVGAVNSSEVIASFSSRGPTADGRIKPEVCAQGVSTYCASASTTTSYTYVGGTSLSTPLIAGCAAALLSARPSLTPQNVRQALMECSDNSDSPDNTYGWGIPDLIQALNWGAKFSSDATVGNVPFTVSFIDDSPVPSTEWSWSFGDGDSAAAQDPVHIYTTTGAYDVTMTIVSDGRPLTMTVENYIHVMADTMKIIGDTVYAGEQAVVDVYVANSQPLDMLTIPLDYSQGMSLILDSFSVAGTRADGFLKLQVGDDAGKIAVLVQNTDNPLPAGSGSVLRFFFRTDAYAFGNWQTDLDTTTVDNRSLVLSSQEFDYTPDVYSSKVVIRDVIRGDANNDGRVDVGDPVYLISYIFRSGPEPITIESGDANFDFTHDIGDAVYLINYVFKEGPAPNDI